MLIAFRGKDRELQLVNPEWEQTTGWKLEEIREQNLDILAEFFPDPHYRQVIPGSDCGRPLVSGTISN